METDARCCCGTGVLPAVLPAALPATDSTGALGVLPDARYDEALLRVNATGALWTTEALLPAFELGRRRAEHPRQPSVLCIGSVGGGSASVFPDFRVSDGMSKAALVYGMKVRSSRPS